MTGKAVLPKSTWHQTLLSCASISAQTSWKAVAVSQFLGENPQKGDAAFPGLFQAQLRSLHQACKAEGPPKAALLPSRGVRFQVSIF